MERKEKGMAENKNYSEETLRAMEIIAQAVVNKVSFDKTIVCTIKDNSNAQYGEYYVTDGSSSFFAYSETTTYEVNESVYVVVPNGNFDNQKLIRGRYVADSDGEAYNYVSPYNKFVSKTDNIIDNPSTRKELVANYDPTISYIPEAKGPSAVVGWTVNQDNIRKINNFDYDVVYLAANFKSLLGMMVSNRQINTGDYGLILQMTLGYLDSKGNKQYDTQNFVLSVEDMNGNPYDFETFYLQEEIYKLDSKYTKNGLEISNVTVTFFQGLKSGVRSNPIVFTDSEGHDIPWYIDETHTLDPNLFAQDVVLKFGYEQEKISTDKITIKSKKIGNGYGSEGQNSDPLKYYSYLPQTEIDRLLEKEDIPQWMIDQDYANYVRRYNEKTIEIDVANTYIEMLQQKTAAELKMIYHLYQYYDPKYGEIVSDSIAGDNWKEVGFKNQLNLEYEFNPDITKEEMLFKVIVTYEAPLGSEEVVDPDTGEVIIPDTKHLRLESNILTFDLVGEVKRIEDEYVVIDCDNDGMFKLYDLKGHLINSWDKSKKRFLHAHKMNGTEKVISKVTWTIPYRNTMIAPITQQEFMDGYSDHSGDVGDRGFEVDEINGVYIYTLYYPSETDFYFRIKDYLTTTDINNTITCQVNFVNSSKSFTLTKELEFCVKQYYGTQYKLDMYFWDKKPVAYGDVSTYDPSPNGNNAAIVGEQQRVKIRVLNADNEDITQELINTGHEFTLDWYSKPTGSPVEFGDLDQANFDFLLNPDDDITFGKRITENALYGRITEDGEQIRIIEDTVGDAGDLNYTETRVTEQNDPGSQVPYTRITEKGDIRRTETDYSQVPDLEEFYGSLILRATVLGVEGETIEGFFPIPVTTSSSYTQYIGPTEILYDSNGANPAYYKKGLELYYIGSDGIEVENEAVTWKITYPDGKTSNYPEFNLTPTSKILQAPPLYVSERKCLNIMAISKATNTCLWIQPIPINIDTWDSPVLSSWEDTPNWNIHNIVAGTANRLPSGNLSGIMIGTVTDVQKETELEAKKANKIVELHKQQDLYNLALIQLNILYATHAPEEEIAAQIEVVNALEAVVNQLYQDIDDINAQIEEIDTISGLYGVKNDNIFFRVTENGDFYAGINGELQFGDDRSLIQSKDHSSIRLDLFHNKFSLNTNSLIIKPHDENGEVIKTPGFTLHSSGLIETSLKRIRANGHDFEETVLDIKDPTSGVITRYRVLAEDLGSVTDNYLELMDGRALQMLDDSFFELIPDVAEEEVEGEVEVFPI